VIGQRVRRKPSVGHVLAVDHRSDGVLIGHVGLSPLGDDFEGDVEVGFAVAEAHQRQGFAVEVPGRITVHGPFLPGPGPSVRTTGSCAFRLRTNP